VTDQGTPSLNVTVSSGNETDYLSGEIEVGPGACVVSTRDTLGELLVAFPRYDATFRFSDPIPLGLFLQAVEKAKAAIS
jgi:hypothetical protein